MNAVEHIRGDYHVGILFHLHLSHLGIYLRQHFRVVAGAVVMEAAESEVLHKRVKTLLFEVGQKLFRPSERVKRLVGELYAVTFESRVYKAAVNLRIVSDEYGTLSAELEERPQRVLLLGGVFEHFVGNAREPVYEFGELAVRIYKHIESVNDPEAFQLDSAYLDDTLRRGVVARHFKVEHDDLVGELWVTAPSVYNLILFEVVIYLVSLDTVQRLEIAAVLDNALNGVNSIGEALHYAVVGDGKSPVTPFKRSLYKSARRGYCVHR